MLALLQITVDNNDTDLDCKNEKKCCNKWLGANTQGTNFPDWSHEAIKWYKNEPPQTPKGNLIGLSETPR